MIWRRPLCQEVHVKPPTPFGFHAVPLLFVFLLAAPFGVSADESLRLFPSTPTQQEKPRPSEGTSSISSGHMAETVPGAGKTALYIGIAGAAAGLGTAMSRKPLINVMQRAADVPSDSDGHGHGHGHGHGD